MENQIPFFILESLYQVSHISDFERYADNSSITVALLAFSYFTGDRIFGQFETDATTMAISATGIPNASYLRHTGFKLKKKVAVPSFLDVSHSGKTINIPVLSITERTATRFRNLLALEHCSPAYGNQFTAFAMFMDYLIDTPEDVAILKTEWHNRTPTGRCDYRAADFFNNLCRGVSLGRGEDHYLVPLFSYVNDYCRRNYYKVKFYQWRKVLLPDYFTTSLAIAGYL